MQSLATVPTDKAVRYMTQLCKHWSHRFTVAFDDKAGRIDLPLGACTLTAGPAALDIVLDAADTEGLTKMEQVVADHLNRFAFREGELTFAWTRTAA